ncbi:hypothetical protein BKA62DRAFT_824579 [Auriculariales sp. MPI-PUGE-AT-0066]|nr:hypothetical protein BKA62DRAFT_824579 [Auriculariales sp. MPI-PUGE-AT-0066]
MTFDRLPAGSWVLVTGATGLAGSAIVDLLLQRGFRVRGAGRSAVKAAEFKEHLTKTYGEGVFEFVEVADMTVSGAFDAHLQGVAGILHVATDTSPETLVDTDGAIATVAAQTLGLMKSAARVNSVKSFVLTSSSSTVAATAVEYGKDIAISTEIYQEHVIPLARSLPADVYPMKAMLGYVSTKIYGEQEAWKYWKETKPSYAFNTVLPFMILGPVINPTKGHYSTHSWINEVFEGKADGLGVVYMNPPEWVVDTRDCAAIHVAALLSTKTNGERLWAAAHPHTLNQYLATWRKAFPDRKLLPDFDFPPAPTIDITDREKSTKLLKEFAGKDWYSFEETALANVSDV